MMCVKEPYGKLSINITCLLWFSIEQQSVWSLNLFCYRSHSALIELHLSPCSAQYIMLCTDTLKREICRLVVSIHRVLRVGLPFRLALPHLLIQDNSSLEPSTQLRRVDFEGCTKSTQFLLLYWLPRHWLFSHCSSFFILVFPFVSFMDSFFPH